MHIKHYRNKNNIYEYKNPTMVISSFKINKLFPNLPVTTLVTSGVYLLIRFSPFFDID